MNGPFKESTLTCEEQGKVPGLQNCALEQHVMLLHGLLTAYPKQNLNNFSKSKQIFEAILKGIEFLLQIFISLQPVRPLIFQITNSGRSISISLKYIRFRPPDCKDIGSRKFEYVTKTQFLSSFILYISV